MTNLPRGGGDGDAIRMGILHIMRENGIREGHRPVSTLPCRIFAKEAPCLPIARGIHALQKTCVINAIYSSSKSGLTHSGRACYDHFVDNVIH